MTPCTKINVKSFIVCIIGLQVFCIAFFTYYSNQCSLDEHKQLITINRDPLSQPQTLKRFKTNHYIKLSNYRAHLNTDPNVLHFGEINEHSLCGIILKISDKKDNSLQQLYATCDSMERCIGFSIHPTIGVLFHSKSSFPLQYVRNWNFYIKNTAQHKVYEMDTFTNKRINYTMDIWSSSMIPSLSSLGLRYAVPIIPRKFMSFEWNLGRTNNQLYSFEAMLQHSVIYLRTLVLPYTSHRNHELGTMLNESLSLWDLNKLSQLVDFVFEFELTTHSIPDMTDYVITHNNDINTQSKTFDISINSDDMKWKRYFENVTEHEKDLQNEPNWNLLSLLHYRAFTNNEGMTLGHEGSVHNNMNEWKCYVSRGSRDKVPHESLKHCRLLHFCLGRYNHFKLDDFPIFDVLQFMIPSARIRLAVDNHIKFWFEQEENFRVAVHRRAMKEGGHDAAGSPYVCRYKAKSLTHSGQYSGLRRHVETVVRKHATQKYGMNEDDINTKISAIADMYDRTCAIDFETIQEVLNFHKQQPLLQKVFWDNSIKEYKDRKDQIERWFLACDNQEPEELKVLMDTYGAVTLNGQVLADFWNGPLYWNMAGDMEKEQKQYGPIVEKQYLKYLKLFASAQQLEREHKEWLKIVNDNHQSKWWYDMSRIEYWRKEIVVFDMWMLRRSQFFIGSWHSTLTRNVCHWRGYENMFNSTNCYLVHKWRAMHNSHFKPAIDSDYANNWFDLSAVDKPVLKWKDGK